MTGHGRKTIIVTGSNAGIGLAIATQAALRGQHVVLACRNAAKAETARQNLQQLAPDAEVSIRELDLASLASVRNFAAQVGRDFSTLDVLINNAGVLPMEQQYTQEGFEMQFGVNYLGHFLLTHLLLPVMQRTPRARIIHVSSLGHYPGRINFNSFYGRRFYLMGLPSYAQSKLANVLLSHELSRRLPSHITSNVVHPGFVDSDFFRNIPGFIYKYWRKLLVSPQQCGQFIADMALSEAWEGRSGEFVSAQGPLPISGKTRDRALAAKLYDESCRLTGVAPLS